MRRSRSRLATVCLAILLALVALLAMVRGLGHVAALSPAVFTVSNVDDSGPGSLRQAILDANATAGADVIQIKAVGTVNLLSALPTIDEAVTLQGPGADLFRVDGQGLYRVFDAGPVAVTIADLAVQQGYVSGANANGGGIRSTGSVALTRVQVLSNTAQSQGGGLFVTGNLALTDSLFQNNRSTNSVGGGVRSNTVTTISGTHFLGNSSQGDGGALFALGQVVITNGLFQANQCLASSCDGGALFAFSQTTISNTQFLSNTAQDQGGGAAAPGLVTITDGLFQGNQAVFGTGGGLFAQNVATLRATQFRGNVSRGHGGGVYALGAMTVTSGMFDGNQSANGAGGGVHAFGPAHVSDTQFLRNVAVGGGGLYQGSFEDGRAVNSLFANNQATNGAGSAMLLASTGTVELLHVTILGQSIGGGSAIEVLAGSVAITNTIVTSHTVGVNNAGGVVAQDYNLFFGNGADSQGVVSGGMHNADGDPAFIAPAQDNYHLGAGSAAIDAGIDATILTDFDGEIRPMAAGFDIGFDEANYIAGLAFTFTPSPASTVGVATIFSATVTHGTGVSYRWDFGDGTAVVVGNPASHTFTTVGLFPVTVTASNSAGSVSTTIAVTAEPPSRQIYLPLVVP